MIIIFLGSSLLCYKIDTVLDLTVFVCFSLAFYLNGGLYKLLCFCVFGQKINWFVLLPSVSIAQNLPLISFLKISGKLLIKNLKQGVNSGNLCFMGFDKLSILERRVS